MRRSCLASRMQETPKRPPSPVFFPLYLARIHDPLRQQVEPGDGLAARAGASCPSRVRRAGSWRHRYVRHRRLCALDGDRPGRAGSGSRQPGVPALSPAALDIAPDDLKQIVARTRQGLKLRGYRFEGDELCKAPRFATLRRTFGDAFSGTELPDSAGNPAGFKAQGKPPHSVFTGDLIDASGQPTVRRSTRSLRFSARLCDNNQTLSTAASAGGR